MYWCAASLALWQAFDCPSTGKVFLDVMKTKYLYQRNITKHNREHNCIFQMVLQLLYVSLHTVNYAYDTISIVLPTNVRRKVKYSSVVLVFFIHISLFICMFRSYFLHAFLNWEIFSHRCIVLKQISCIPIVCSPLYPFLTRLICSVRYCLFTYFYSFYTVFVFMCMWSNIYATRIVFVFINMHLCISASR